jgi:tryptophan synthase beta chain
MTSLLKSGEAETLLQAAINGELPDERGRFGPFGGRYVPETLVPAFERLEAGVKEPARAARVGRPADCAHARTTAWRALGR